MTLSYSIGLTTGSALAYLLNALLGPHSSVDPCQPLNVTDVAADGISKWNNTQMHPLYDLPPSEFFPG